MEKLLLVDGNSILNRGFYALPLLTNSDGVYTNAILGFMNILFKVMNDESPDYVIVAFDVKAPTFRHELFKEYKGTRKPMPDELRMQLPIIREVLSSMKIAIVEKAGFEADDILGTFAKRYQKEGYDITLLSGDRDLLQISDANIKISIPKTTGGKTETFNYYPDDVIREYGVTPLQFIEVKSLQGDTADNIPGVTKVGPKTATDLIVKYDNLEGIYAHIDDQKGKLKDNLINDKEQAFLSRVLAKINIDAPVSVNIADCKCNQMLNEESLQVLRKYALKTVLQRLEAKGNDDNNNVSTVEKLEYRVVDSYDEALDVLSKLSKASEAAINADKNLGIAVCFGDELIYIKAEAFLSCDFLKENVAQSIAKIKTLATYKIKNSYDWIGEYSKNFNDVEILAYLVDPLKGDYPLEDLSLKYINKVFADSKELSANSELYSVVSAYVALNTLKPLLNDLNELGMARLYKEIEMPLSYVLFSMEKEGILVDIDELKKYGDELSAGIKELEKKIYAAAGEEFNINSPKQLGEILFEKLQLPYGKKTKTGYSTAADVLEKLAAEAPIVRDILEYRTLSKLNSTYVEGLSAFVAEDGRIHSHFNQTITATGRISSTEPNLQNIPIRTEEGRKLRKVFYAKDGFTFLDADYSQIELRLMAHMSKDDKLIEAYQNNKDIHTSTASKVFHVPFDEVTSLQRRNAKAVNFGIIYGISSFGLSQDLSISVAEAKQYINDYFVEYPKVKQFMDVCVLGAKDTGFAKTLFGRVRPIPELKSSNFMQRSFGERVAMNAPLQGTAADIMKIAMINIFNRLKNERLESKLLIQVHDEVLVETKLEEKEIVYKIITEEMSNAASLSVNLETDAHFGNNWYEAK